MILASVGMPHEIGPENKRKVKTRTLIYLLCSLFLPFLWQGQAWPDKAERERKKRKRESSCCGVRVAVGLLVPGLRSEN